MGFLYVHRYRVTTICLGDHDDRPKWQLVSPFNDCTDVLLLHKTNTLLPQIFSALIAFWQQILRSEKHAFLRAYACRDFGHVGFSQNSLGSSETTSRVGSSLFLNKFLDTFYTSFKNNKYIRWLRDTPLEHLKFEKEICIWKCKRQFGRHFGFLPFIFVIESKWFEW